MTTSGLLVLEEKPRAMGYRFPAEFERHCATWLSWPHKEESWPGKLQAIYPVYGHFVRLVAEGEVVCINVNDETMKQHAISHLEKAGADLANVHFFIHPTNDAWCRDHGPAFLVNANAKYPRIIVDWNYNAWGGKYPPYDLDDQIPTRIAGQLGLPVAYPGIVMEGGSVDFNGQGTLLTTTSCLLHPNRNPALDQSAIEAYLRNYYGVDDILWLHDGIEGDDTDGHVDDLTRFVNKNTVVTAVEHNRDDANYAPLLDNLKRLESFRLADGKPLNIVELPMPARIDYEGMRLPASYANFYISNKYVVVPLYSDKQDDKAIAVLERCFPDRKVVGLDSRDITWGLGSFHCLSQQEPEV